MGEIEELGGEFNRAFSVIQEERGFLGRTMTIILRVMLEVEIVQIDAAEMVSKGWRDVFSGRFAAGILEICGGLCESITGIDPPGMADLIGTPTLASLTAATASGKSTCFSVYVAETQENFSKQGIQWTLEVSQTIQQASLNFPWIEMNC